jgi:hypothetical protein
MITFNGLTQDEILALPEDVLQNDIVCGEPMVIRIGTADVLGRFWVEDKSLVLELGHIDGGGEGVLPAVAVLAQRYASLRGLMAIDWRVHAITCREPNLKLRRLLERRGFQVVNVAGTGPCYHKIQPIAQRAFVASTGFDYDSAQQGAKP